MYYNAVDDITYRNNKEDVNDDIDSLIFPINVHESLQSSSGLKRGEKTGLIIAFWLFVCAVLGWFLLGWLRQFTTHYFLMVLLVELVLQLTVGVYLLRFVMDEKSIFSEMNTSDLIFSNYFRIYKEIKKENSRYPFDIIEFSDGSYGVFIQFRLGHNTQIRSNNTYMANSEFINLLMKSGLCCKTFVHNESFKGSEAADNLRNILKNIDDPKLFSAYREIIQNYLDIAEEESNVMCITNIIYAQTRISKDDLISNVERILNIFSKEDTVYRQVSILTYDEIVEFFRIYYKLEVLDMGLVHASVAERKNIYNCPVKVIKLYGTSGKIYANEEFNRLSEDIVSSGGLQQFNKV